MTTMFRKAGNSLGHVLRALLPLALALPIVAHAQGKDLRAGTSMAPDHPAALLLKKFSQSLETRTGGKLRLVVHTGGVLVPTCRCRARCRPERRT